MKIIVTVSISVPKTTPRRWMLLDKDLLSLFLNLNFPTVFNKNVLLIAYTEKKMIKIVIFTHFGNSIPLYEENLTIIESKTARPAKIKMKPKDVRLFSDKDRMGIFPLTSLIRETIVNRIASR